MSSPSISRTTRNFRSQTTATTTLRLTIGRFQRQTNLTFMNSKTPTLSNVCQHMTSEDVSSIPWTTKKNSQVPSYAPVLQSYTMRLTKNTFLTPSYEILPSFALLPQSRHPILTSNESYTLKSTSTSNRFILYMNQFHLCSQ